MGNFNKIKSFFEEKSYIDFIIIPLIVILISFMVSNHVTNIMIDHGREFYIPEQMLNGKVLYKDITLIYFPLGYYFNAFIYKIFGVSITSLIISQTIFCSLYMNVYYLLSREFLSRKNSFVLCLLIIFACIFAKTSFFNFIMPYSYTMVYGVMFFTIFIFFLVKLFKTDKLIYAYLAAISAGLTLCFKFEFYIALVLLIAGLFLYKKLKIKQYIMILLLFFIFPMLLLISLFLQGVTFQNLYEAIDFGIKFAHTPAMFRFLSDTGMYPTHIFKQMLNFIKYTPSVLIIILSCFFTFKLYQVYKKKYIFPFFAVFIWFYLFYLYKITLFWVMLPILVLVLFIVNFKKLYLCSEKSIILIIIAGLLNSQRVFFSLSFLGYGTFAFPLLFLAFMVILKHILPEHISLVKTKNLICFILIILTGFHSFNLCLKYIDTPYKIQFSKGTIYTTKEEWRELNFLIRYIEAYLMPTSTLLVLPEGNFLNFVTDRNVDMNCFMMDRLYHDAYGREEAKEKIAKTNSDYIILIDDGKNGTFKYPFLYKRDHSLAYIYIAENYSVIEKAKFNKTYYTILKKNEK